MSEAIGPPDPKIETSDSISTPPETTTSAWRAMILAVATLTASNPEPQKRETMSPGVPTLYPACSAADLARLPPWSLNCSQQPTITSSVECATDGYRLCNSWSKHVNKPRGDWVCSLPAAFPRPRGVRIAS